MAFDGTVVRALAKELNKTISGGRIGKIAQPEKDELILTIRGIGKDKRLLLSANPSLPLICFEEEARPSSNQPPAFCMLLRKHIQNGKVTKVSQTDFERVLQIQIEHRDEMGDKAFKYLMIEIMGKHSNIILVDEDNIILDSIKRITPEISSVRTVLPNESYFIPRTEAKRNPLTESENDLISFIASGSTPLCKAVYESLTGFSPMLANELCERSGIDGDLQASSLSSVEQQKLSSALKELLSILKDGSFAPCIYYDKNGKPKDVTAFPCKLYSGLKEVPIDNISEALSSYYYEKSKADRLRQKSSDLRILLNHQLAKLSNKLKLQNKQLKDTEKREKYKLYGELLHVYGYDIPQKSSFYLADNYYDNNNKVQIALDPNLSPAQNAQAYFEKYSKAKRTYDALTKLIPETEQQLAYLDSIIMYLGKIKSEEDIFELKEDLIKNGFLKKHNDKKGLKAKSGKPSFLHYLSPNNRDIYVGKNNLQNEYLTFKLASKNDWWFHTKAVAGSHVILKNDNREEIPDEDFEAAAKLAAYYSSCETGKAEIDYTQRKNLIKPPGSPSGYVIYHTNYSMMIDNDISNLKQAE